MLSAGFCASRSIDAILATPEAVAAYLAAEAEAGRKPSTIGRRCAAIRHAHRLAGYDPPTASEIVKATTRGIRRTHGVAPRKLAAATSEKTIGMAAMVRQDLIGKRDRAILLVGFSMAARRSELVALDMDDITFCDEGMRIRVKRSKTDQEGQGCTVAVPFGQRACPVEALRSYLAMAGITRGPIFRSIRRGGHVQDRRLGAKHVLLVVKQHAAKLGLDASTFGAHSLRSGFITSAAARGASIFKMQAVSRHKSVDVLSGYVRDADAFNNHAGAGLL